MQPGVVPNEKMKRLDDWFVEEIKKQQAETRKAPIEKLPAPQVMPSGPAAIPRPPLEEIKLEKIKEISQFINWCLAPEREILDKEKIANEIKRIARMEQLEDSLMILLEAKESTLDPLRAHFQPKKLTPEEKSLNPEQLKAKLKELEAKKSAQEINFEIINKVINTLIREIQEELKRRPRVTKKVRRLPGEARKIIKPELSSQLFEAIKKGDEKLVKDLIAAGADVNQTDKTGITPLGLAIEENKYDIAKLLIHVGADLKKCNNNLFDEAIKKGDEKQVKFLLDAGVDLFSCDDGEICA